MLKIRLKRGGRKHLPIYTIVLMESLTRRDGKSIAVLGYYEPITKRIKVNQIELQKRINQGARPTNTIRHLLERFLIRNQSLIRASKTRI